MGQMSALPTREQPEARFSKKLPATRTSSLPLRNDINPPPLPPHYSPPKETPRESSNKRAKRDGNVVNELQQKNDDLARELRDIKAKKDKNACK